MVDSLNYISLERNDNFSTLRGLDLQELIVEIENFYLEYRKSLNFPSQVTFGVEIEYEGFIKFYVDKYIESNYEIIEHKGVDYYSIGMCLLKITNSILINNWQSKKDSSLNFGGEVSSAILYDKIDDWKQLRQLCKYLRKKRAITNLRAGGHIHIGAHILEADVDKWRKFIKLYTVYENILFRFFYGDKLTKRLNQNQYAPSIVDEIILSRDKINSVTDVSELKKILPKSKFQAINFKNVNFSKKSYDDSKNTLEFRCPNSTDNEIVWQNNINTAVKLMLASTRLEVDWELLDYKFKNIKNLSQNQNYMYNEICLEQVLEFVDFVFDNNLDKAYFLRQYFKNFQDNFYLESGIKTKKFTR